MCASLFRNYDNHLHSHKASYLVREMKAIDRIQIWIGAFLELYDAEETFERYCNWIHERRRKLEGNMPKWYDNIKMGLKETIFVYT